MSTLALVGRRRASLDIAVQIAGRLLNLALGILVTALIVRTLGRAGFGQWATVMAIVQLATQFGVLGLDTVAVRTAAADPERESTWIGAQVRLRVLLAVPVTLASICAIALLSSNSAMTASGLLIAGTLVTGAAGSLQIAWQLRVRNDVNVAILTLNSVLWTGAVLAVAAGGGGMVALAAGFLGVAAITTVLQIALVVRHVPIQLRGTGKAVGQLARLALPVGIGTLLMYAYGQIDQVLVYQISGDAAAGLYGAVYRVLASAMFLPAAVMMTLFPIISAAYASDPARVERLLRTAVDYLAMASLPALAFTLVAAEPIVKLLFGDEFLPAADALRILMAAFVPVCLVFLTGNMLIVLKRQNALITCALIALAANVALNLTFLPTYGYIAAAWATLVTELLIAALTARVVTREIGTRIWSGRLLKTIGAAAAMGVVVAVLRDAGVLLAGLVAAALVVYPALLFLVGAIDGEELRGLIRRTPAE